MKKVGKCLIFSLIAFLIGLSNTFAKEYDLQTVGELVLEENPDAESFYIIGKYIFTMNYVKENNLNTEDFMLAARSINLLENEGKVKGTEAYKKMSAYQILSHTDDDGSVLDWYIGENLIGENKIDDQTKFEVGFIDYTEIENIYTVIFQDETGKELEKREVIEGHKVAAPMNYTKEGYYFEGWYNENEPFNVMEENITKDMTLTQKWTPKTVTIKFDGEIDSTTKEKTYTYPDITPSDLADTKPTSDEKYIFKYWYDSSSDKMEAFDFNKELELNRNESSKTIVLKAKLEDAHKVIFKGQVDGQSNDSFISSSATQYANAKHKLTSDQIPPTEKEGYTFIGWFTENDQQITPADYVFTDLENVVIGKWEKKVYTITFDTDGGTEISKRQVKHGEKVENPGNAEKISQDKYNGYEFIGWYLCKENTCDESFDFNTTITSNLTLKAKYKQVVYTNKMMNDFASQITNENISAFVREDTKLDIAVINGEASLSKNISHIVTVLGDFVEIKNVDTIQLNEGIALTKQNVQEELQKLLDSLTDYETAKLEDLYNISFTINFSLKEGVTNETDSNTSTYTAHFNTKSIPVSNEKELEAALSGNQEIIIKNWEGDITKPLTISKDIVIDGRDTEITSTINEHKPVFTIKSGSVVIKDLTLKIDVLKPSEYNKEAKNAKKNKNTIGIEVGEKATLTANNFHVKNKETINESTMKIGDDDLKASTVTINENAAILLKGTLYASNISYEDEIYGSPTVLATKEATMNVLGGNKQEYIYNVVRNNDGSGEETKRVSDYIHYYKDYKHSRLIFVNYVPMSRTYTNIAHINNEQYFVPKTFDENGSNYKYKNEITEKKYVFTNEWEYSSDLESGTISNEDLKNEKATLTSGDYTYYAQYNEIPAPVIQKFYAGEKEGTKTTTSNTINLHLSWDDDNVKSYCITKSEDKSGCEWKNIKDEKQIIQKLDFNNFDDYTYHAYLKNDEDVISKEATTTISYIKKDYTGKASGLMNYQPTGLSNKLVDGMYRYSGKDVENYICFGTSDVEACLKEPNKYLYQIIGVTQGGKFKLIKSTPYSWKIWNDKYYLSSCGEGGYRCKYPNSKLYDTLNAEFAKTLSLDWDKKVDTATWFIGTITSENKTGHSVYESETKDRTTNGKYGLMYASDYFYAYGDGTGNKNCLKDSCDSYLTTSYSEWTITRQYYDSTIYSGYAYYIHSVDRNLRTIVMDVELGIRPVFYLKLDTSIKSGIGSKTRPFIIEN